MRSGTVVTLSVLVMACAQVTPSHVRGINDMDADAHFRRGFAYQNSGRYDLAIDAYTKTLNKDPRHAGAFANRGLVAQSTELC